MLLGDNAVRTEGGVAAADQWTLRSPVMRSHGRDVIALSQDKSESV